MSFLATLLQSHSFRTQTMGFVLAALALFILAGALLHLRWRATRGSGRHCSVNSESGSAAAMDYVFTMPIFLFIVLLALQFMMLVNASLLVHHAAYSAARTARVYGFERSSVTAMGQAVNPDVANNFALLWALNQDEARDRAWESAALALISAAPASDKVAPPSPKPTPAFRALPAYFAAAMSSHESIRSEAMLRKAAYAFDEDNTRVEVSLRAEVQDLVGAALGGVNGAPGQGEWIVQAEVYHLFYLTLPIARYLGDRQPDGSYRWEMYAEVSII